MDALRLPVWTVAVTPNTKTAPNLLFSAVVVPVHLQQSPASWNGCVKDWVRNHELSGSFTMPIQRPSVNDSESNHGMEIINS